MIISVSGIKRSASTVQFNLIRIAMIKAGWDVETFGHHYEPTETKENECQIVKRHPFKRSIAEAADKIFLTDRDDNEILASLERFEGKKQDPKRITKMRANLQLWAKHSDIPIFPYKLWLNSPMQYTGKIIDYLGVDVDLREVLETFKKIEPPDEGYDPETCLFHNHITTKNI